MGKKKLEDLELQFINNTHLIKDLIIHYTDGELFECILEGYNPNDNSFTVVKNYVKPKRGIIQDNRVISGFDYIDKIEIVYFDNTIQVFE